VTVTSSAPPQFRPDNAVQQKEAKRRQTIVEHTPKDGRIGGGVEEWCGERNSVKSHADRSIYSGGGESLIKGVNELLSEVITKCH